MRYILGVAVAAACLMPAGFFAPAGAVGALAVGQTAAGVARDGIAMGTAWNYDDQQVADSKALENCHNYKSAQRAAKECKLVGAIKAKQCYAIAMDPKAGTPGVGWAIADDQDTAKSQALANCKVTAGGARASFCSVSESNCDGKK